MSTSVLERIVESKRMPILFIGSGLSKRYLYKYPNWDELLQLSYQKISPDMFQFHKYHDQLSRQKLTPFELNARLASIIEDKFNEAFFDRKIKLDKVKNPNWVSHGISPYKMFLSRYFRKMTLYKSPQTIEELTKLRMLKNKVSAVITTNYDQFLEKEVFSPDFKVFVRQNELFSSDSYNIAEIYKIHGCASDASSIIITEDDYNNFKASRKLIIAKMLTLFADSPIVFLGYSFKDENIQSIIVEFLSCLTPKELSNIDEHFVFISYKKGVSVLREIKRTIVVKDGEIPITEIETDNFSAVYDILNKVTPGVSPVRIRETKKIVKTIVDQSMASKEAESIIVGIDDLSQMDLSSKPLAIAIGYRENILNKVGYGRFEDEKIFEDILYDNNHFDANQMCLERFRSIASSRLLPVFKYIKNATVSIEANEKLAKYALLHGSKELILPSNIQKQIRNLPVITSYDEILVELEKIPDINKKAGLFLKSIGNFTPEQIRSTCQQIFTIDTTAAMSSTHFKRCVLYLDLIENKIN